jgi:hypothetical protein
MGRFRVETKRLRMSASPGREKKGVSHTPESLVACPAERDDSTPIAIYHLPHNVLSLISFRRFSL